jgi:hypothetical protein
MQAMHRQTLRSKQQGSWMDRQTDGRHLDMQPRSDGQTLRSKKPLMTNWPVYVPVIVDDCPAASKPIAQTNSCSMTAHAVAGQSIIQACQCVYALSVCLSVCLPVCPSAHPPINLSIHLCKQLGALRYMMYAYANGGHACLSVCLSACLRWASAPSPGQRCRRGRCRRSQGQCP